MALLAACALLLATGGSTRGQRRAAVIDRHGQRPLGSRPPAAAAAVPPTTLPDECWMLDVMMMMPSLTYAGAQAKCKADKPVSCWAEPAGSPYDARLVLTPHPPPPPPPPPLAASLRARRTLTP